MNSNFLHASLQAKMVNNRINKLINGEGTILYSTSYIEGEVMGFYKRLLGENMPTLQGIDSIVVKNGRLINVKQRRMLCEDLRLEELDRALKSIHLDSTPAIDGISSFFFKYIWPFVAHDVYTTIHKFFTYGNLYAPINCTLVTLLPKALHASSITQFRPISCWFVLYNLIAKVLSNRLE